MSVQFSHIGCTDPIQRRKKQQAAQVPDDVRIVVWRLLGQVGAPSTTTAITCLLSSLLQVPADAGALQARCQWANTAYTTLVAAPAMPDTYSTLEQPLLGQGTSAPLDSVSERSSLSSAQSTDAAVDLGSAITVAEGKLLAAAAAPAGCSDDDDGISDTDVAYVTDSIPAKQIIQQQDADDEHELVSPGSYSVLGIQDSSGDLSSYAYEYSNSSSSISDGLSPEPSFSQQQQHLTSATLAAADAAAAQEQASSNAYAGADADAGTGSSSDVDFQQLSAMPDRTPYLRLDIPKGPATGGLMSPISTTSTRPLRGAVSLSTLSLSSMEVSEALPDETSGTQNSEDGLAAAAYLLDAPKADSAAAASTAAAGVDSMGETVIGDDCSLAELLGDPLAFEQLMAVEPAQLTPQQQQKLVTPQSAQPAAVQDTMDSVFAAATAAASAAAADHSDSQEIMDAAAAVCGLGLELDPSKLLPKEDTLPPAALLKFAEVSSEITAITDEVEDADEQSLLDMSASVSPSVEIADLRDSSSSSARSSFSGSSSLTKDQLPDLGLTVTVPTAADKAAARAAEMTAARSLAAAAKKRAGRGAYDDLLEPPIAQEGLRLLSAAHIIPHVDKV